MAFGIGGSGKRRDAEEGWKYVDGVKIKVAGIRAKQNSTSRFEVVGLCKIPHGEYEENVTGGFAVNDNPNGLPLLDIDSGGERMHDPVCTKALKKIIEEEGYYQR